jgi:hypothetical protein
VDTRRRRSLEGASHEGRHVFREKGGMNLHESCNVFSGFVERLFRPFSNILSAILKRILRRLVTYFQAFFIV